MSYARMPARLVATFVLFAALAAAPLVAQDGAQAGAQATDTPPAGSYTVDPAHATIGFVAQHLGISDIHGRFREVTGEFTLGDQPSFKASVPVDTVDTGVEKRDEHLKSPDFFEARQFPTIEFETTQVSVTDDGTYELVGDFTMHGQTNQITLPLTYNGQIEFQGQQRVGFSGEVTIDRREWGLDAWQGLVSNEIRLIISFEGIRQ